MWRGRSARNGRPLDSQGLLKAVNPARQLGDELSQFPDLRRQVWGVQMLLRENGFLAHYLGKRDQTVRERGVIIASGLMAGGALGGVFGAAFRLLPGFTEDWLRSPFYGNEPISQSVSAILFAGLCCYIWFGSLKKEREV